MKKQIAKDSLTAKVLAFEKNTIINELEANAGNFSRTAFVLRVSLSTLRRKVRELGIDLSKYRHVKGCKCGQCKPTAQTREETKAPIECACCKGPGANKRVYLVDEQGIVDTESFPVCPRCYLEHCGKTPGFVSATTDTQKEGDQ